MNAKKYVRLVLGGVLAMGMLFASGTVLADKDWGPSCRSRLEADRARIDRDAARHGRDSAIVRRDIDRMDATRKWCRDHKADWDHSRFDVGIYVHP